MSKSAITLSIIFGFVFITGIWFVGNYNDLVKTKNQVEKSWSMVETQYQRRFDLVDNLVEVVKASQKQELAVFTAIANGRKAYNSASTIDGKAAAVGQIETNIALVPRLQEAYPELKSNIQVTALMNELSGTENGILKVRDSFNVTATNYNTNISSFPKNIFASIFHFGKVPLFKAESGAEKAVKVKF